MSTDTIKPAFIIPASHALQGFVGTVREFFAAIREGLAAAQHYERLTAQGNPPQKAVEIVFRKHFQIRR